MLEILILRHGESTAALERERRHQGRADLPLTDRGRQQAALAAAWVAEHVPLDAIHASPLRRAAETAQILAAVVGVPVLYDDDLMEFDNGALAGLAFADAAARYPDPPGGYRLHEAVPDGESDIAFRARVETVWSRLVSGAAPNGCLAIVSHGGTINRLFQSFLGLPMHADVRVASDDASLHLWRVDGSRRQVVFANKTDHLLARQD